MRPRGGSGFDIVCLSHLRWDLVYQRPQHLLSRAAATRRVLFVEEPVHDADTPRLELRRELRSLWVATPHLPDHLGPAETESCVAELLPALLQDQRIDHYVLWFLTPMALPLTRGLAPLAVVYDCMDELTGFAGAPAGLAEREDELLTRADLVFTGGRSLYEAKRDRHDNAFLFPSSVDAAHFAAAREPQPEPDDQAPLARPRLGYAGVIDERMDLALLAGVADARPDWQLVLVGPVVKIDPATLPERPNVHYLGAQPYAALPAYMAGWDAGLIPFAHNEATRFISPTKTPEYLAAGLPVVSTSIGDVVSPYGELGLVRIADDVHGFVAAAEQAMCADRKEHRRRADEALAATSWDRTWQVMLRLLEETIRYPAPTATRRSEFDWLVVGAGFAGSVLAERLASQAGQRVLVLDRRNHIGGNAYDHYDDAGVLVHRYGPHIFHTNSADVFDYLSAFTEWRPYEHRVRASVDGRLVPMPINLETVNELYGLQLSVLELEQFLARVAEPVEHPRTSEDVVVGKVGRELYEKLFRNYTRKQWGLDPSELDASVTARVPTRVSRDDRYFTDRFQAMPRHGYTRLFERMLDHPNIKLMLQTDLAEVRDAIPHRGVIYTGRVDEYFGYRYGRLPYRSLEFRFETTDEAQHQPVPVVNYPNEHPYTRCTEFKQLTGQLHPKTTVVYEYPRDEGDPYYPVPRPENAELYRRYKALAEACAGVHFVGRLATYRYYNMDQVVAQALATFRRIAGHERRPAAASASLGAASGRVGSA